MIIRNKHLISFFLFLCVFNSYGQNHCSFPAENKFNTELGSTINIFDWTEVEYSGIYLNNDAGGTIEITPQSPFHFNNQDENIDHLKVPILKDNLPEDGWELLATNFGEDSQSGQAGVSIPSFLLYNRYEAVVRSFFYIPESLAAADGFTNAQVKFDFKSTISNKESALFTHFQSPAKALDNFEKQLAATNPNFYNNGGNYWLFADYPVAYDPCTCNHFTWFKIDPNLLNIQEVTLDITGGGTITPIVSGGSPQSNALFSSSIGQLDAISSTGVKISKSLQGFHTFVEGLTAVYDLESGTLSNGYNSLTPEKKKTYNKLHRKAFTFPGWTKDIPKFGMYLGLAEYIIGGGKGSGSSGPTSFEANLNFSAEGLITTNAPFEGLEVYTPGSDQSAVDSDVTSDLHYNNILGIFNILETPHVDFEHTIRIEDDPNDQHQQRDYYVQSLFKLQNDIKYVINPASALSQVPVDIKAAFVIKGAPTVDMDLVTSTSTQLERISNNNTEYYQTPFLPLTCINDYIIKLDYVGTPEEGNTFIIELKIMATLKRDEQLDPFFNSEADDVLFIANYTVNTFEVPEATLPDPSSISYIPTQRVLEDITFTQDETIYAWGSIMLGENIVTNGNEITIIAGNEIFGDLTNLPENLNLVIGSPSECEGSVPAQTPNQVNTFCSGNYNPLAPPPATQLVDNSSNNNQLYDFELEVFPNPFLDHINVKYSLTVEDKVNLVLQNALGQVIKEENFTQSKGKHSVTMDDLNLPNGMYYLTLKTTDMVKTTKITNQNN